MSQKRALCIHDMAGVGKCSLTVILPVLSAMGHEASPLPTTVLSAHTGGFGNIARAPLDDFCKSALAHYSEIGHSFDAVYSGYVANINQLKIINAALEQNKKAVFILDPVMGDGGKMYSSLPTDLPCEMRKLSKKADLLVPNTTEAALLLDMPYSELFTQKMAFEMLEGLSRICSGDIVVTGVCLQDGKYANACRKKSGEVQVLYYDKQTGAYPGTGDIFAAVLTGATLLGDDFFVAVQKAAEFVNICVRLANDDAREPKYGVPFEKALKHLCMFIGEKTDNV